LDDFCTTIIGEINMINNVEHGTSYTPNMAPWKIDPPKSRVSAIPLYWQ